MLLPFLFQLTLKHLRRGGRVSAVKAVLGDVLNIKPILHVDNDGKLVQLSKARGFKKRDSFFSRLSR